MCCITNIDTDAIVLIASMVCGRLMTRSFAEKIDTLMAFCSREALMLLWTCVCPDVPLCIYGVLYERNVAIVMHAIHRARDALLDEDSDFMILLDCVQTADDACSLLTETGLVVACIVSNWTRHEVKVLRIECSVGVRNVRATAHRCILKRDAIVRFGTYAPFERQDYISISCPHRREMWVVDAIAIG